MVLSLTAFPLSDVRFLLDACEFLRIGNDTNGSYLLCLHFNRHDAIGSIIDANDEPWLSIDFSQFNTGTLWQKAFARPQAKACHRLTPSNRTRGRSFDLPAAIGPHGHIFGQHLHQGGHLPGLNRLQKTGEQLLLGVARRWETWPVVAQVLLRPTEPLAPGHFPFTEKAGNLAIVVLENFTQQEDRPLNRLQLF